MDSSSVEFKGIVTDVKRTSNGKEWSTYLTVRALKSGIITKAYYTFKCPIEKGDLIILFGNEEENATIHIEMMPMVYLGTDKVTITDCLKRALYSLNKSKHKQYALLQANKLIAHVESIKCEDLDKSIGQRVDELLSTLAEDMIYNHSTKVLSYFNSFMNDNEVKILLKWWFKHRCVRKLELFGLKINEIREAQVKTSELYELILINPFTVPYFDLGTAKNIQKILNRKVDDIDLVYGGILRWVYSQCYNNNWDYVPQDNLINQFKNLEIDDVEHLINEYNLVFEDEKVFCKFNYQAELFISEKLNLLKNSADDTSISQDLIDDAFKDKNLSEDQAKAVNSILINKINLVNGRAGTGKTFILSRLTDFLHSIGKKILIVSFTGKAISRIKELVNIKLANITTIHRFLHSYSPDLVLYDFIFVDETSMVNVCLFYRFLKALEIGRNNYLPHITFIGDTHQLPPINWSSLLENLTESNKFIVNELTRIHRTDQTEKNGIFVNSDEIRNWTKEQGGLKLEQFYNFHLVEGNMDRIDSMVSSLLSSGSILDDIVILSPYNDEVTKLNTLMRKHLPNNRSVNDYLGRNWMVGDRVMLTKNNYDIEVMNGDEGKIIDVNMSFVTVEFFSKPYKFKLTKPVEEEFLLDDESFTELTTKYITHSYALTLHKSQGSERNVVILYMGREATSFITNNLLYVAVTRAVKLFIMVGRVKTFRLGVTNLMPKRYISLKDRFI